MNIERNMSCLMLIKEIAPAELIGRRDLIIMLYVVNIDYLISLYSPSISLK